MISNKNSEAFFSNLEKFIPDKGLGPLVLLKKIVDLDCKWLIISSEDEINKFLI